MNAPDKIFLPDVQAFADNRALAIDRVGIRRLRFPIQVARAGQSALSTVAEFDLYVGLEASVKGTHMSRFVEVLHTHGADYSPAGMRVLARQILERLEAPTAYIKARFPYFVAKRAPVSGVESLMDYEVEFTVEARSATDIDVSVKVVVPVTSLCPCSKKISEYGAHNQRSHITIDASVGEDAPALEDLIAIAEAEASCEIWGLLKRPDEKYVTERAYDNPKFVEDLVRDVALALESDDRVLAYTVESDNFESIHNHSAYALIRSDKKARRA